MGDVRDKPATSAFFSRYRSPTFSKVEVKALLDIIEKYKSIIFNKSTSAAANHAKELTWSKIAKVYNSQGFHHKRSVDSLKIKLDNLKKVVRKLSNNLMDEKYSESDNVYRQIAVMMCDSENNTSNVEEPVMSDDEINNMNISTGEKHNNVSTNANWNDNEEQVFDESVESDDEKERNRSSNFSPQECSLLLQCVRQEKSIILSKSNTATHNRIKNYAWKRVTNSYNKLSPQKRTTKVLQTKFMNMKRMARNVSFRNCLKDFNKKDKLEDSSSLKEDMENYYYYTIMGGQAKIKVDVIPHKFLLQPNHKEQSVTTPRRAAKKIRKQQKPEEVLNESPKSIDQELDIQIETVMSVEHIKVDNSPPHAVFNENITVDTQNDIKNPNITTQKIKSEPLFEDARDSDADSDNYDYGHPAMDRKSSTDSRVGPGLDPLNTVLSSDSGLGSINLSENKEIVKLKLDLLNYELETAKLQRKRLEDLVQAEAADRESKVIENSLRLRAARLEVVAAEMKLPAAHPALPYTAQEIPAQHYIDQYLSQ